MSHMAALPGRSRHVHPRGGYAHVASLVASAVLQVSGSRPARAQSEPLPSLPPPPTVLPAIPPPPPTLAGLAPRTPIVVSGCRALDGSYCHDGLYLRLGLGLAYSSFLGTGPRGNASISGAGVAFSVAIGGPIARGLVVGGTFRFADGGGRFTGSPADATGSGSGYLGQIGSLFVDWYPDPERGWHAGAVVGARQHGCYRFERQGLLGGWIRLWGSRWPRLVDRTAVVARYADESPFFDLRNDDGLERELYGVCVRTSRRRPRGVDSLALSLPESIRGALRRVSEGRVLGGPRSRQADGGTAYLQTHVRKSLSPGGAGHVSPGPSDRARSPAGDRALRPPLAGSSGACEKRGQLGSDASNRGGDRGAGNKNSEFAAKNTQAPLAQLDRATASGAVGQRFESSVAR